MGGLRAVLANVDGATLFRHVALLVATLAVWPLREPLHAGNSVLWIIGLAAALNLLPTLLRRRGERRTVWRVWSFALGIATWTALVHVTGGVVSPFIAGYWIEVMLSGLAWNPIAPLFASLVSVAALWLQQFVPGPLDVTQPLVVHSVLLAVLGGAAFHVMRRWTHAQVDLASRHAKLGARLEGLERELEGLERELENTRVLGELGRNTARLAHGMKNAVHGLRGFTTLLDTRIPGSNRDRQLLDGLTKTIDRLDDMARDCLGARPGNGEPASFSQEADTNRAILEAIGEVAASHPEVRFDTVVGNSLPDVDVPPDVLREVTTILVRNAAEAMNGRGDARVRVSVQSGRFELEVADQGLGLTDDVMSNLFTPGYTTKPNGSGFGLYLARRLLTSYGGTLAARSRRLGGSSFTAVLPTRGG